jgi:hypothetical protein
MSSLGYGQTYQSVTRTSGTTYYNTTGKPISIFPNIVWNGGGAFTITVDSVVIVSTNLPGITGGTTLSTPGATIKAGANYVLTAGGTNTISSVNELR